ncbi:MAG: hypothetical protein PHW74_00495 [Desulfobacca sp.]|nr:hypothetical protein [Desulfobacca sp.]
MSVKESWSSGTIKVVDQGKKIGIIQDIDGGDVFFSLDDFILPESVTDTSEIAQEQKTVIFQKVPSKLGSEAKKIAILDNLIKK